MIYYANMRFPKKSTTASCILFTQDTIDAAIKSINETRGYKVVKTVATEEECVVTIEINTTEIDGPCFD